MIQLLHLTLPADRAAILLSELATLRKQVERESKEAEAKGAPYGRSLVRDGEVVETLREFCRQIEGAME